MAENKKLVKEISQIAIKNVELEKKSAYLDAFKDLLTNDCTYYKEQVNKIEKLKSTLSDNAVHFQSERAELALALLEISNCKDLELVKEIARIALSQVHTNVRLKNTVPF